MGSLRVISGRTGMRRVPWWAHLMRRVFSGSAFRQGWRLTLVFVM
jgi:hypothetical protein